jgi:hypothetical protein
MFNGSLGEASNRTRLDIDLPLDAIYTTYGMSAATMLKRLLEVGKPHEAIIALLASPVPRTGVGRYAYGEFEIINSYGVVPYDIRLNGVQIATLLPKKQDAVDIPSDDVDKSGVHELLETFSRIPPIQKRQVMYGLNITMSQPETASIGDAFNFEGRLMHAREVVLPRYDVALPKLTFNAT